MDKTCAIVIPIYKTDFNIIDKTSLDFLIENSSEYTKENYPVYLIGPEKINPELENLSKYLSKGNFKVEIKTFEDKFFKSTASYSQLLKNHDFYKVFDNFDYILIYQNDCLMIEDNLKQWLDKDYDYIGAPILSDRSGWKKVPIVGNGGCSLRKVKYFKNVTNPKGAFLKKYKKQLSEEVSARGPEGYQDYEDLYFAELIAYYYGMKRPTFKQSLDFAFDMNPDFAKVFKTDPNKLPDFIHAYDKNLRWYDKIKGFKDKIKNYDTLYNLCETKHAELHKIYMIDKNNPTSTL